jgi:hypothetical protein
MNVMKSVGGVEMPEYLGKLAAPEADEGTKKS